MASRSVWQLDSRLRLLCEDWLGQCRAEGLDPLITCTYRSSEEQDELYALGRTKPGKKVTNAKGGQSKHNAVDQAGVPASLAFDFVPMRSGKCVWGVRAAEDRKLWERCVALAEALGLRSGRWFTNSKGEPFEDWPHLELAEQENEL